MASDHRTVIVRLKAKVGMEAKVTQELFNLLAPTRAEPGCINFDMHEAPSDPSLFLFHEDWASEEDLKRCFETPHIPRWIQQNLVSGTLDLTHLRKVNEQQLHVVSGKGNNPNAFVMHREK